MSISKEIPQDIIAGIKSEIEFMKLELHEAAMSGKGSTGIYMKYMERVFNFGKWVGGDEGYKSGRKVAYCEMRDIISRQQGKPVEALFEILGKIMRK